MTSEQIDLARRLPRDVYLLALSLVLDPASRSPDYRWIPDLTSDAVGGVLLGMLGDGWAAECDHGRWTVRCRRRPGRPFPGPALGPDLVCEGATLAEAAARALLEVTPCDR